MLAASKCGQRISAERTSSERNGVLDGAGRRWKQFGGARGQGARRIYSGTKSLALRGFVSVRAY